MDSYSHKINQEKQFLLLTVVGFMRDDDFKSMANESLRLMKEHRLTKCLVDTSEMQVMTMESMSWIQTDWYPNALALGLTKIAFITPKSAFGEVSVKSTNEKIEQESVLEIAYFTAIQEAEAWLTS